MDRYFNITHASDFDKLDKLGRGNENRWNNPSDRFDNQRRDPDKNSYFRSGTGQPMPPGELNRRDYLDDMIIPRPPSFRRDSRSPEYRKRDDDFPEAPRFERGLDEHPRSFNQQSGNSGFRGDIDERYLSPSTSGRYNFERSSTYSGVKGESMDKGPNFRGRKREFDHRNDFEGQRAYKNQHFVPKQKSSWEPQVKKPFKKEFPPKPNQTGPVPDPLNVEKNIKMAVIPEDYPEVVLDEEQMNLVQNFVLDKIDLRTEGIKPSFNDCKIESDYLIFDCFNINTKNWLKKVLAESPIEGIPLKMISAKEITNFTEVSISIPDKSADPASVLKRIENQNEGFKTKLWKVLHSEADDEKLTIFLNIDSRSLEKIRRSEFKLGYKFTRVKVELIGEDPEKAIEANSEENGQVSKALMCFECKQLGHFARKCPMKRANFYVDKNPAPEMIKTCHRCGKVGHFAKFCPLADKISEAVCFKCGNQGHFARKCKTKQKSNDGPDN